MVPPAQAEAPAFDTRDHAMMRLAMDQALNASLHGEVPVGAVLVKDGQVIATGYNHPVGSHDPSAHAEMRALRMAAEQLGNYRVGASTLYVTLEPCMMCLGAILHARVTRVVFGAHDPKTGVCGSVLNLPAHGQLNHQTQVEGGLLAEECGRLLQDFFAQRRAQRRAARDALRAQQDELARWRPRCLRKPRWVNCGWKGTDWMRRHLREQRGGPDVQVSASTVERLPLGGAAQPVDALAQRRFCGIPGP